MKVWHFWDWWHIERQDNATLVQGRPRWVPEATYEDPTLDFLGSWPTVLRDPVSESWRMLYPMAGFPLCLMGAQSADGIHWSPLSAPEVDPGGPKLAPNHLFYLERANTGPVSYQPEAPDGYPFKLYCVQRGGAGATETRLQDKAVFHELVGGSRTRRTAAENRIARSKNGLQWELDPTASWNLPGWHPDPATMVFFNRHLGKYTMTTRPGWGDRRLVTVDSVDGRKWENLQWVLQPDPLDPPGTQFYGMSVHPYGEAYVGFLHMAHFDNAEPLRRFNQLYGPADCQLTYSFDGRHWLRGLREPFIGLNEPGQPGAGVVFPSALVETETELRIYSASTPDLHFQYGSTQFVRKGTIPPAAILLHTIRKDGFNYLQSKGNWAEICSKPFVLLEPDLYANILAPCGQAAFQLSDIESRPLTGVK